MMQFFPGLSCHKEATPKNLFSPKNSGGVSTTPPPSVTLRPLSTRFADGGFDTHTKVSADSPSICWATAVEYLSVRILHNVCFSAKFHLCCTANQTSVPFLKNCLKRNFKRSITPLWRSSLARLYCSAAYRTTRPSNFLFYQRRLRLRFAFYIVNGDFVPINLHS